MEECLDLATIFGVGKNTIREWEREGRLPRPVEIAGRSFRKPDDIRRLIDQRGVSLRGGKPGSRRK